MLCAVLYKSWKQHLTKQTTSHLIKQLRKTGKDELINNFCLGILHMNEPMLANQQGLTDIKCVWSLDTIKKT